MRAKRILIWITVLLIAGAGIFLIFRPRSVIVETAIVTKGRFIGTIEEDGRTRVRDRFTVSAPLTGRLSRISLRAGDPIKKGQTIAIIEPSLPPLLDPRTSRGLKARVGAAEAAVEEARATQQRLRVTRDKAKTALDRKQKLRARGVSAASTLDDAKYAFDAAKRDLVAAEMRSHAAEHSLEAARAALRRTSDPGPAASEHLNVTAPVDGRVLRIHKESEAAVIAGASLIEIGKPGDLEIIVDLLTTDAVRVSDGVKVSIEQWGGPTPLQGRVRRVEPSAFTKISALGVEEQRVWVVIDIVSPPKLWARLADGFRIETRIIVDDIPNAIIVPIGALFRRNNAWHVFVASDGVASIRRIEVAKRSGRTATIAKGLSQGDKIVVFPPSSLSNGTRITEK